MQHGALQRKETTSRNHGWSKVMNYHKTFPYALHSEWYYCYFYFYCCYLLPRSMVGLKTFLQANGTLSVIAPRGRAFGVISLLHRVTLINKRTHL